MGCSDCIAMILAGGQGKRLGVLTKDVPKPILTFGGGCRLIDFTLSNCVYSGIETVGILTQYKQTEFNNYISDGKAWANEQTSLNITMLPPYVSNYEESIYKGTADAVYKNSHFIEQHGGKDILILSGDHVYKMNYKEMINSHKSSGAAVTIGVVEVPRSEAANFGIITADKENNVKHFEEKPKYPQSNLASMGIYIFNWEIVKKYVFICSYNKISQLDLGRHIIPLMLMLGEKIRAYKFNNYWKNVGTVNSLWEANMDLLSPVPGINMIDDNIKIFSADDYQTLCYKSYYNIQNSIIAKGSDIFGAVKRSIISSGVFTGRNSVIIDSIIMPGATIGCNSVVYKSIVGSDAIIGDYAVVGGSGKNNDADNRKRRYNGIITIGNGTHIGSRMKIPANYM